jgi:putative PIN family toxin of toxin-antitoxin system
MKIILDTNVIFTGLKSRKGASFCLLSLLTGKKFSITIAVPLIIEYESVLTRGQLPASISEKDIGDVIDFLCHIGSKQDIFFLWRPCLPDPSDDLVLEVAVAGDCDAIVTYNKKHFKHAGKFGLNVYDPKEFLIEIGVLK